MRVNWSGFKANNPFRHQGYWSYRSGYLLVDLVIQSIWFACLFSPGNWLGAIFSYQATNGQYYARSGPKDLYLIVVFLFSWLAGLTSIFNSPSEVIVGFSIVFLVEIVVYHFWILIVRPKIDPNYIQYSALRTTILTAMAFLNVVNLYSAIYYYGLNSHFETNLTPWLAWAYSVGEITGSGYSGVTAGATELLAITSGSEKLVGVLFLVIIIGLALSRNSTPEIGDQISELHSSPLDRHTVNDENVNSSEQQGDETKAADVSTKNVQ
jgi:hypothetical protein